MSRLQAVSIAGGAAGPRAQQLSGQAAFPMAETRSL